MARYVLLVSKDDLFRDTMRTEAISNGSATIASIQEMHAPSLQVVQHLQFTGGIEVLALDLANAPEAPQHIASLEGERDSAVENWPRLKDFRERLHFFAKAPNWQFGLFLKLARFFRSHGTQSVHTHHIGPLIYAGIAARIARVPTIIHTEHDAWHLENRKRRWVQKLILALVRPTLVADCDLVADNMRKHLGKRDIVVIRNGIDTDRFKAGDKAAARHKLALPKHNRLIGCAGRLEPVKGQATLIEALAQMSPDIHLALAGRGSCEEALRQQAQRLGLAERVHFLGHVDDIPSFYHAIDLFCLPSFNEGFPLSALEAQACSVPSAVTDVGGSRETLCPQTGTLLRAGDAEGMAKALDEAWHRGATQDPREFVCRSGDLKQMRHAYQSLQKSAG